MMRTPEELADDILDETDRDFANDRATSWQAALKINIAAAIHKDRADNMAKAPNGEKEAKDTMKSEGGILEGEK